MDQALADLADPVLRVTGNDVPLPYAANSERLPLPQVTDLLEADCILCLRNYK